MDKERLFAIFQDNYMSGRDVKNRLPLNIDADTFVKELIARRKFSPRTEMVPLHNLKGQPYWYVQTDKIVAASEVICEAALSWEGGDITPTKQMTEEMFFTSYLEGSHMNYSDGVDFLVSDDEEPDSIEQQILYNNREAWLGILRYIYRPLDKTMVMQLAARLTEGLEHPADGYRTLDDQGIAIMGSEDYMVPKAFAIENMMEELYSFMVNPNYHPLIKASVSQAYILATRPFPSGNERLARMVSAILLYQNGYGFFKDVSFSRIMANEMPLYYNAVREIIREVNDSDLTYFVEYYLNMLVKALQRMTPLITPPKPPSDSLPVGASAGDAALPSVAASSALPTGSPCDDKTTWDSDACVGKIHPCSLEQLLIIMKSDSIVHYEMRDGFTDEVLTEQTFKPGSNSRRTFTVIIETYVKGEEYITVSDIADRIGISKCNASVSRDYLRGRKLIVADDEDDEVKKKYKLAFDPHRVYLGEADVVIFYTKQSADAMDESTLDVSDGEFVHYSNMNDNMSSIVNGTVVNTMNSDANPEKRPIADVINELMDNESFSVERKIGLVLKECLEQGLKCLCFDDIVKGLGCSNKTARELMGVGEQLGIIVQDKDKYHICEYVTPGVHLEGMNSCQYDRFQLIYNSFGMDHFGIEDLAAVYGTETSAAIRFAQIYCRRGLLNKARIGATMRYSIKEEAVTLLDQQGYLVKVAV